MATLEYDSSGNDLKFNFAFNLKPDILAKRLEVRHVLGSACRGCGAPGARGGLEEPIPGGCPQRLAGEAGTHTACVCQFPICRHLLVSSFNCATFLKSTQKHI